MSFCSTCGPAQPNLAMKLLKYNDRLVHGAFAVKNFGGGDMVVILANQLADTADPLSISKLLTSIAWQADKVEAQLSEGDEN